MKVRYVAHPSPARKHLVECHNLWSTLVLRVSLAEVTATAASGYYGRLSHRASYLPLNGWGVINQYEGALHARVRPLATGHMDARRARMPYGLHGSTSVYVLLTEVQASIHMRR